MDPVSAELPKGARIGDVSPEPSEAERAAITAALSRLWDELWPETVVTTVPDPSPRWRYADRYWQRRSSYGGWV